MSLPVEGNPGGCVCGDACLSPCWQRVGLSSDPCCEGCAPLPIVLPDTLKCHARVSDLCYHGWVQQDWREDGTYRESTDTIVCDACFVEVMEASPSGNGLLREIDGTLRLLRERAGSSIPTTGDTPC